MTIKEVAHSLHKLSVAGYFNGEKFTEKELCEYIAGMFRANLKNKNLVMEIALPDGRWYFTIDNPKNTADGFSYHIPETRTQETRILDALLH